MTCTTCGRENPPHLTFCQECGQRLGPRIAPPTPPIGLPGGADEKPRGGTQLGGVIAQPSASPAPPPTTSERRCRVCDTLNAAGLRYCTSCGSTLEAGPPPIVQPPPPPSPVAATISDANPPRFDLPLAPSPAPIAPIAPVRVVDAAPAAAAPAARTCNRCRGVVDPGAMFCKFCGASLGDSPRPEVRESRPDASPAPLLPHERLELPKPADNGRPATAPIPQVSEPRPQPIIAGHISAPIQASPIAASLSPSPKPVSAAIAAVTAPPPQPVAVISNAISQAPPVPSRQSARPAAPAVVRGRLVVIAKSGADGPSYPIGDTLDVGRVEGHIVVGEDPYLSPRHARISWVEDKGRGRLVLRDLASTNGVFLRLAAARDAAGGGHPGGEVSVPLLDQDLILVGQQVLRFEVLKEAESGLGPAVEHGTLLFGSPASPRYARLGQRTVEGVTRDVYYVRKMETVLGRESGDIVFTEDPFLSRRHAAVRVQGSGSAGMQRTFSLVDLGSSNGTFLKIREDVELHAADHFRVGQQLFRVDLDAGAKG